MIILALRLRAAVRLREPAAKRLFTFSILYLFLLFAVLFAEEAGGPTRLGGAG